MPWSNKEPQLLSLHSRAHELQLLKPMYLEDVFHSERSTAMRSLCNAMESGPNGHNYRKPAHSTEDPVQPKINKFLKGKNNEKD